MAVAFETFTTNTGFGVTTRPINKPTGSVAGNVLFITIMQSNRSYGTVTGFTNVASIPFSTSSGATILRRVLDGSEGASFSVSFGPSTNMDIVCARFSGMDPTTPVEASTTTPSGASSTTHTAPSVTSLSAGAMILRVYFTTSTSSYTISGPTKFYDFHGNGGVMGAGALQASAGSSGTQAATLSAAAPWAAASLALKPLPGAVELVQSVGMVPIA